MPNDTHDLYAGFEGEPELIIELRFGGSVDCRLRAWIGYFVELMEAYPPPPGGWSGIAYHHHMYTGWNVGEWIDPAPATTIEILKQARDACHDARVVSFATLLIQLYERVQASGGNVVWKLD